jgi:uncharacterized membrane protein
MERQHIFGVISVALGVLVAGICLKLGIKANSEVFQALIISQASVLGIVISFGILSIQISTKEYTPLITRIFQEDHFLSNKIWLFGISIFLSLLFLLLTPIFTNTEAGGQFYLYLQVLP